MRIWVVILKILKEDLLKNISKNIYTIDIYIYTYTYV